MTTGAAHGGRWQSVWPYAGAAALAAGLLAALVAAVGGDVLGALGALVRASFGTLGGVGQTLNKVVPLLLGSLAVVLGMRGGVFNIGVDGQIYAGAVTATGLALAAPGLPGAVALPVALVAGLAGGAAWAALPALLRARYAVSEIFVTVMLNFIALFGVEYLSTGPWNDPMAGEAITRPIARAYQLPLLLPQGGAHAGILLAVLAAVVVWALLYRTVLGYEIRATGDNPSAARLGGIPVEGTTALVLVLSGALAGLAGAVEVTGFHHRLILGLSPGYGVMSILIAVLGRRTVPGAVVGSVLFAVLVVGSDSLQRSAGLPASAVFVLQAAILLFLLAAEGIRARRRA
ncbi:MAG: ABC transporter permease [candidate division GAL15 bacterium]